METIQSIQSESRFEESSQGGQQFESRMERVFRTLHDVQPELMRLYSGDYKQFSDLACPNCSNLAIEPRDCPGCGEQICKPCFNGMSTNARGNRWSKCASCKQTFGNDFKNTGKAVQGMLRNATFSCVNECGKMYLPLHKIEDHLE